MSWFTSFWRDKQAQVVLFSSTAVALYGYDQGMMSLINTNTDYLSTMGIAEESPLVGVIVAVYYLGCSVGAVLGSYAADMIGRRTSIFACLAVATLGNLIMFIAGLFKIPSGTPALAIILVGRIVMGLGVGGIDSVVPVYSSELSSEGGRGKALAQEFQANILGLNIAFAVNLATTYTLGKENQWAWRIPIVLMNIFPIALMSLIQFLPESPRFYIYHDREEDAQDALQKIYSSDDAKSKLKELQEAHDKEPSSISYTNMLTPGHDQFHPTFLTVMAQINQALTGYGAISVYGPQIFELLGFGVAEAEFITQGNYISYLLLMTFAWLLIDAVGRRALMVWNSGGLILMFLLLTLFGGLASQADQLGISKLPPGILGCIALYVATGHFGIGWLATVFLIPTEIYPTSARAQGTAVSVVVWGLSNFLVTLLTPILFNNLQYWLFLVFAGTNLVAGLSTYLYQPECGGRSFEENQEFFEHCREEGSWRVGKVAGGKFRHFPPATKGGDGDGETQPLLGRVREQL